MATSTLLMVLGLAVLRGVALPPVLARHRVWVRGLGGCCLMAAVGFAVKAQGLAVGLTCALVLAMLVAPVLALAAPLWPRATRYVWPVGALGLAWLWSGAV
ncbi:hypothetical protein HUA74_44630 [Myxococcus sp. CA051A]|uniref:hypothetical protein n=1 Tax=unclassified Myxococcus TaxID=2648731 RepID=UPI00157A9BF5|nr:MULTISPECIES: hypothetical protein [unclassified Myxococcus]NTX41006.1 hypothetical protein [Myxococcus sp. CA033]NTX67751.1 hypothetical protein [Myxococcus sp. CA051A]